MGTILASWGLNRQVEWLRKGGGFLVGFVVTTFLALALGILYRGIWLPLVLIGLLSLLFAWHPRTSQSLQTKPFMMFFGLVAVSQWMRAVTLSPVRDLLVKVDPIPPIMLFFSLIALIIWIKRGLRDGADYPWFCVAIFCLTGWGVVSLSGSQGGADPMIQFAMERFNLSLETAETVVLIFRKCVHFTAYGVMALNAMHLAGPKFDLQKAALFGIGAAGLFSLFDEFRQSSSVGRTGSLWDVGLDMLGAATFVGLSVLRYRHLQRNAI